MIKMDGTIDFPQNDSQNIYTLEISSTGELLYQTQPLESQWYAESIYALLESIEDHHKNVLTDGLLKKKQGWKAVAATMAKKGFDCSAEDCSKKFRNMKKTYCSILKRQIGGEFSSVKYPYFDQLHKLLKDECDPVGLQQRGLDLALNKKQTLMKGIKPYDDLDADDDVMWTLSNTTLLIYSIEMYKGAFDVCDPTEIDTIWEKVRENLIKNDVYVRIEQCQRKWLNLIEGFKFHLSIGERTGVPPNWPYYKDVSSIMHAANIPVSKLNGPFRKKRKISYSDIPEEQIELDLRNYKPINTSFLNTDINKLKVQTEECRAQLDTMTEFNEKLDNLENTQSKKSKLHLLHEALTTVLKKSSEEVDSHTIIIEGTEE